MTRRPFAVRSTCGVLSLVPCLYLHEEEKLVNKSLYCHLPPPPQRRVTAPRLYAQFLVSLGFSTAVPPAEKCPTRRVTQSQSRVEA